MRTPFFTFYYDYDDSKYYETCAFNLKNQIEDAGGKLKLKQQPLTESYLLNCLEKPKLILNELIESRSALIWIDSDCFIRKLPTQLDELYKYDVGFVIRNHDYKTPHAALIYFNYTENSLKFVNEWVLKCESEKQNTLNGTYKCGDHCKLIETYNEMHYINYAFLSPLVASTNLTNSMVQIGISPGGIAVEKAK